MGAVRQILDVFDCVSPLDYRTLDDDFEDIAALMSERGYLTEACAVEVALVEVLHEYQRCPGDVVEEIRAAVKEVTAPEVYAEEKRIKHDVRALVNRIMAKLSPAARTFVHRTATSFDIRNTADAVRLRKATKTILVPALIQWETTCVRMARQEAHTKQIGRTHGQHAVPITFGYELARYASRIGGCILRVQAAAENLKGKFSGAVGAHNAALLFFEDPEEFERRVLARLGLEQDEISSQIVAPEPLQGFLDALLMTAGVLANMADDFRNLQRTEIREVLEGGRKEQAPGSATVGSSTMPHKKNPVDSENVKSVWKVIMGQHVTACLDQISEHSRDLTNSASSRVYISETISYTVAMVRRSLQVLRGLAVNRDRMLQNLRMTGDQITSEPLQLLLSDTGHPESHEVVRKLSRKAEAEGGSLVEAAFADADLIPFLKKLTPDQEKALRNPVEHYCGIAAEKALRISQTWAERFNISLEGVAA